MDFKKLQTESIEQDIKEHYFALFRNEWTVHYFEQQLKNLPKDSQPQEKERLQAQKEAAENVVKEMTEKLESIKVIAEKYK